MLMDNVSRLMAQKKKGQSWVEAVAPVLIEVNSEIKEIEGKKDGETAPLKSQIKEIDEKYKGALVALNEIDMRLRNEVVKEVKSTEAIQSPDGGKLVFAESTEIEYGDVGEVDSKYLMKVVDVKKVKEALSKGIVNIKGIKVVPEISLRVYTK